MLPLVVCQRRTSSCGKCLSLLNSVLESVMQKIVDGVRQFQKGQFEDHRGLFEELAGGQSPLALFITCSDSRIDPNMVTQTKPGQLFVIRTAGNIVPPYDVVRGGEAATIEYAVRALNVSDIVICGHSQCGAMGGLLNPEALTTLPAVEEYLQSAEATRQNIEADYANVTDPAEKLTLTVKENVLVQLENLKTHPSVIEALEKDTVNLHGWVYEFETGAVTAHQAESGEFEAI